MATAPPPYLYCLRAGSPAEPRCFITMWQYTPPPPGTELSRGIVWFEGVWVDEEEGERKLTRLSGTGIMLKGSGDTRGGRVEQRGWLGSFGKLTHARKDVSREDVWKTHWFKKKFDYINLPWNTVKYCDIYSEICILGLKGFLSSAPEFNFNYWVTIETIYN